MERKDYRLEIVGALIGSSCHSRELARKLEINHMMLNRKFKELVEQNVMDYRVEGKNKVYFMKNSVEARSFVFMAENYKLIKLLEKNPTLRRIVDYVVSDKRFGLCVLFGSYTKGIADKKSDVDIFVETGSKVLKNDLEKLDSKVSVKIGKFDRSSSLGKEILKNHVVIKGVERLYG
ncbi:MAG: nucleotidyltransferase domain-containing protein [Nanoarchaeota archaeon]|nr:nucleotidyltransferase domain-containing protein [Nanoarchaeota archaeon]